jgi:hypothetical protein
MSVSVPPQVVALAAAVSLPRNRVARAALAETLEAVRAGRIAATSLLRGLREDHCLALLELALKNHTRRRWPWSR